MMAGAAYTFGTLQASAHWQIVDLLSDLHLQASEPATFETWRAHMHNTSADAVLLLGDVFEIWVGDDAVVHDPFLQACAQVLQQTSARITVGFMPGNRDFLVGQAFLNDCGVQALQDPTVLVWGTQHMLLSHGDALCLGDEAYQRFRSLARTPQWQAEFLGTPLPERLRQAQAMREQSQAHNQSMSTFADADPDMTRQWLQQARSQYLIHGHTHQPADHAVPGGGLRQVLSDWQTQAGHCRAQVLRLHADGRSERLPPHVGAPERRKSRSA